MIFTLASVNFRFLHGSRIAFMVFAAIGAQLPFSMMPIVRFL